MCIGRADFCHLIMPSKVNTEGAQKYRPPAVTKPSRSADSCCPVHRGPSSSVDTFPLVGKETFCSLPQGTGVRFGWPLQFWAHRPIQSGFGV
jgi:hypothetical protein